MHLQTRSIIASKCISTLARSWPPSASPSSLNHGLQVHLWVHLITRSSSASLNSLDHDLGVHLWVQSITASKRISTYTRLPHLSASPNLLEHGFVLGGYLGTKYKYKYSPRIYLTCLLIQLYLLIRFCLVIFACFLLACLNCFLLWGWGLTHPSSSSSTLTDLAISLATVEMAHLSGSMPTVLAISLRSVDMSRFAFLCHSTRVSILIVNPSSSPITPAIHRTQFATKRYW